MRVVPKKGPQCLCLRGRPRRLPGLLQLTYNSTWELAVPASTNCGP
jgi:hypothetical protein